MANKTNEGGGNGSAKVFRALASVCGVIALLAFLFNLIDSSPECLALMAVTGLGAAICLVVSFGLTDDARETPAAYGARASSTRAHTRWDTYLHEMARASQALFDFLKELSDNARCRNILNDLPEMAGLDHATGSFAITPRLAALVYCDVRDCFRRLGKSPASLDNLEGMGYAMFMCLLISKGFDVNRFFDRRQTHELARTIEKLDHTVVCEVNIEGHEGESRFMVVFGKAHGEHDWAQRYSSLLYRWASLIAKADGAVTPEESDALAAIMKMWEGEKPSGDVRVSASSAPSTETLPVATKAMDDTPVGAPNPGADRRRDLSDAMKALDALVGLDPVKAEVRKLASFIEIQKKRMALGLKTAPISYHGVFTGNPGTGKTTVARILADIYRSLGILQKGHLVETDRSGLVAEYVGQTAVKTNKIVDSALDGVLFIDEAYSLVQGGNGDYGAEAIATLLKRMEDDRSRLVVILAGYTDEMRSFIDSNPGLRSRFNRHIEFPDYSADELARIFLASAAKNQYTCDQDVRESITSIMARAVAAKDRSFGNARYVRNLFENAIQRQAVRLSTVAPLTAHMLSELTLHDLGFKYEA